jgi:hypothetical protein
MAQSRTVQCCDCGQPIRAEDVTPYQVSRWSTGYGGRGFRVYSRRQRVSLCPDCRANRERWDNRTRGVGGLITIAFIAYIVLRASSVL